MEIDGQVYRIGDILESTDVTEEIDMCPVGTKVEVVCFCNKSGGYYIGVVNFEEMPNWHDLDGRCPHGRGLWMTRSTLARCFVKKEEFYVVNKNFMHRRRNLKGMKFRLLTKTGHDRMIMAEMEEDVGGGGGDGLGKAGHCVLLPAGLASKVQTKKKSK